MSTSRPQIAPPVAIWIPARIGSTRLPDKPLIEVGGRPLLAHTVEVARAAAGLMEPDVSVRVVTDSPAIEQVARAGGAAVSIVRARCKSGTDRLARARRALPEDKRPEVIVNLQGDEPLAPPRVVANLADFALQREEVAMSTAMHPGVRNEGEVAVVVDRCDKALYFSRAPVPGRHPGRPEPAQHTGASWGAHVGLYAYRGELLERWLDLNEGALERIEGLEQLRALEYGIPVAVMRIDERARGLPWFSVDTKADLQRFEALLTSTSTPARGS